MAGAGEDWGSPEQVIAQDNDGITSFFEGGEEWIQARWWNGYRAGVGATEGGPCGRGKPGRTIGYPAPVAIGMPFGYSPPEYWDGTRVSVSVSAGGFWRSWHFDCDGVREIFLLDVGIIAQSSDDLVHAEIQQRPRVTTSDPAGSHDYAADDELPSIEIFADSNTWFQKFGYTVSFVAVRFDPAAPVPLPEEVPPYEPAPPLTEPVYIDLGSCGVRPL